MIKKVTIPELLIVDRLALEAIQGMKEDGIDQWTDAYPRAIHFEQDILHEVLFGFYEDQELLGVCCIKVEDETDQAYFDLTNWTDEISMVIHRLLVAPKARGKGIAKAFFHFAEQLALEQGKTSIKVDTHEENYKMRSLIERNGYLYMGYLPSINRFAYEKVL